MMDRCYRENATGYHNYGGRRIIVCESWHTYENFEKDMGIRPTGTSIDRIDNDGMYEPGNCKWSTPKEQGERRRTNIMVEYEGRNMNLSAWSRELGFNYSRVWKKMQDGYAFEKAIRD